MKSLRQTSLAAAMLLLPVSAALVAAPAAAQHQGSARPAVGSLALNADAGLAPGSTLRVELSATPGAQWAEVVLGGSGIRIPLRERHPGQYVGRHVVRQSDRIDPLQVMTARVAAGQASVARNFSYPAAFQAMAMGAPANGYGSAGRGAGPRRWDRQAPTIGAVTPQQGERIGERGVTRITAHIEDAGSGIDPASVALRVDGQDVSDAIRLNEDQLRYRADLAPGRHTAELMVRDRAGNTSTKSWSFDVVQADRYGAYGAYPVR